MIATLPMYLRAENRSAHDVFWSLIRDHLRDAGIWAPDNLDHECAIWNGLRAPSLLLGQACSLPFRSALHETLDLVGTADYGLPGAAPGYYYSVFVVSKSAAASTPEEHFSGTLAFNARDSHSGWAAPQRFAASRDARFLTSLETGAHVESARAVAQGRADIAAIDAVSWRGIERWDASARDLAVIGRTEASPGLAFVTAKGGPVAALREALTHAIETLPDDERDLLGLRQLVQIPRTDYLQSSLADAA